MNLHNGEVLCWAGDPKSMVSSRVSEFLGTVSFVILKVVYNPKNTFLPKIPDKIDEGLGASPNKKWHF